MKNEKAKHTPGPWETRHTPACAKEGYYKIIARLNTQDVIGRWPAHTNPDDSDKANAALIAAAPELMNACQMAVNEMPGNEQGQKIASMLRAAIAKAEGK